MVSKCSLKNKQTIQKTNNKGYLQGSAAAHELLRS
jgi:hypothetical protein